MISRTRVVQRGIICLLMMKNVIILTHRVEISLNKAELWAIIDMSIYVRDREDLAQNSFYHKIRNIISSQAEVHNLKSQNHISCLGIFRSKLTYTAKICRLQP